MSEPTRPKETQPEKGGKPSRAMDGLIQAERLLQIAFILPAAVLVGWVAGVLMDRWLHQHWIYLMGIILGCVAGFVQVFRLVLGMEKNKQ